MKMDARGIFIMSVVVLLAVTAWRVMDVVELRRDDQARAEESALNQNVNPKLDPYNPIGVIGFVSNQFASETLVVPVNPFHPSFEDMVSQVRVVNGTNVVIVTTRSGNSYIVPADGEGQGQGGIIQARPNQPAPGQPPPTWGRPGWRQVPPGNNRGGIRGFNPGKKNVPYVVFGGFIERPDGVYAPYVKSTLTGGRFLAKGDFIHGAVVTSAGKEGVVCEFSNGKKIAVLPGGAPVAFTPENEDGVAENRGGGQ